MSVCSEKWRGVAGVEWGLGTGLLYPASASWPGSPVSLALLRCSSHSMNESLNEP